MEDDMSKTLLWIDDDNTILSGLFDELKRKQGYFIDVAKNAEQAYHLCLNWKKYDAIIVDLILPPKNRADEPNKIVTMWDQEELMGIGILKWLREDLKYTRPLILLSVWDDPIEKYHLHEYKIDLVLCKKGLMPQIVTENILSLFQEHI